MMVPRTSNILRTNVLDVRGVVIRTFAVLCIVLCGLWRDATAQGGQCECTLYYLCDQINVDVDSPKCASPEVCCRQVNLIDLQLPTTNHNNNGRNEDPPPKYEDQSECVCKPAVDCPEVSGSFQLDLRFQGTKKKGECPVENHVCCPVNNVNNNANNKNNNNNNNNKNNNGEEAEFQECGIRKGVKDKNTVFRITAPNSEVSFGEFPWMMAILTTKENSDGSFTKNVFQCGASLIRPNVVLTAAHCVHDLKLEDIKVRAGEWDTLTINDTSLEPYPFQEIGVVQVIVHKDFYLAAVYNDIALLILKRDLPMTKHINLICIPSSEQDYDPDSCLVTGWGKDQFGVQGRYQSRLRMLDLRLVLRNACQDQLRQTRLGDRFLLHESFICAKGDDKKDACKGDGGGPLICRLRSDSARYTQVGIVSWGIGCGGDVPGVYADVMRFHRWILRNSDSQRLDTRFTG